MVGKYYVITKDKVITGSSLNTINKRMKIKLEDCEMISCGPDKVVKVNSDDLDFLQDKRRIERIPIANLYKTDVMQKYLMIALMIMTFIILVRG